MPRIATLALIIATCCSTPSFADVSYASRDYDFASRQLSDFTSRFERDLVNPVSRGVKARSPATKVNAKFLADGSGTQSSPQSSYLSATAVPAGVASQGVAAQMASKYPAAERAKANKLFNDLLAGYGQIERKFDIPPQDVAGSVAAFIAGSYMAYRNVDFPDQNFKPLVDQMRGIIGNNPEFIKAPDTAKREMYEQLAILGMMMATTQMALKQQPNGQVESNMKQAAKGYLEQFLKTDADKVELTAQGLVLR